MEIKQKENKIRALLADDHSLVRAGIKRLIEDNANVTVVAEAINGIETIKEYKKCRPDILILDIMMPDMDGLEACKQIVAFDPGARILALTMYSEKLFAVRLLKAGALGYINKKAELSELCKAVKYVAAGKNYLSLEIADSVVSQLLKLKDKNNITELLSDREMQVLSLIAQGKKLKEISESLMLRIGTVANYRNRVLKKLNLYSNADIIEFAHQTGII